MTEFILAIETSCDETACAILTSHGVHAEIVYSQTEHARFGGVVPEVAARDHQIRLPLMLSALLRESGCSLPQIREVAYTHGPGLAGCLLIGHYYALGLSTALNIPLRGMHHLEGHIMSALITTGQGSWKDRFLDCCPCVALIVSGGHTLLVEISTESYVLLGETRDDAVGEIFDKIARVMGLDYPGGAALSHLASQGNPIYTLPRPMIDRKDAHMSFSGLKTAARVLYETLQLKNAQMPQAESENDFHQIRCDFAASFEQAIIDTLLNKVGYAVRSTGHKTFVLGGGVSANHRLRQALQVWCNAEGVRCILPDIAYCGDNATMIGVAAWVRRDLRVPILNPAMRLNATLCW